MQLGTSLWQVPVGGGEERPVVDGVIGPFVPMRNGIYFLKVKPNLLINATLEFFRFATGKLETLSDFKEEVSTGLSVSPDERRVLYTQIDSPPADLMLVQNFR